MKKPQGTLVSFLKRNAVYIVMALCIVAIGFSIIFMLIPTNKTLDNTPDTGVSSPVDPDDEKPSEDEPQKPTDTIVTFVMPVDGPTSIGEYSETMVFNSTLSRYSAHLAIDFYAPEGTNVYAVYGGTVESVTNSILHGYTVTIDHGNGLKTVYNSLADGDAVVEGQTVNAGDVIGEVSLTNRQEYKAGAHLHFEVLEDGELINPEKYLNIENK